MSSCQIEHNYKSKGREDLGKRKSQPYPLITLLGSSGFFGEVKYMQQKEVIQYLLTVPASSE